ncbi:MAG TPA: RNA polymerase sigma factor [Acidobacteriaceae bacterium]|nr:RNA polymerase sigma factor [Acidobacteriaceae bacterium]
MDETELIAAARGGNEDAFAELYRQHVRYVRAIGRSILRKNDLDDMCQETFLRAFTRLDTFDVTLKFRPWITRIAINQCLRTLRQGRQASNGDSHLVQMDVEMADEAFDRFVFASADTQLEGVSARLDLDRLLQLLKPLERQALEMAYLEGVPYMEIAAVLGVPLTTVRSKIHSAKIKLRNKCDEK